MTDAAIADDLMSPEAIRDPYRHFGPLRREDPVHWNERHRSWLVTRHADVEACFGDRRLSSDRVRPHYAGHDDDPVDDGRASWLRTIRTVLADWMVFRDPPAHTRLRRSVAQAFTPRTVALLEPRVQEIVDGLLDAVEGPDEVDLVREFAFPLPAIVIAELLGVPASDREYFKELSDELNPLVFGELTEGGRHERAGRALLTLADYFRDLMRHYREHPGDNLVSTLVARYEADGLTEDEVAANCVLLLFAGHETTTNLLACSLLALFEHPEQRVALQRDPGLAPRAVEEFLRYDGPTKLSVRWVAEDLRLGGREIRTGQRVMLLQATANRDPDVFDRPDELVLDRAVNPHLAFGLNIHFCLGAPLARLETRVAVPRLLERYPDLRPTGAAPEWQPTIMIRGPRTLPVHPGAAARPTEGRAR
jgi:cytochrome P450